MESFMFKYMFFCFERGGQICSVFSAGRGIWILICSKVPGLKRKMNRWKKMTPKP